MAGEGLGFEVEVGAAVGVDVAVGSAGPVDADGEDPDVQAIDDAIRSAVQTIPALLIT
jgi:hypothetical protein